MKFWSRRLMVFAMLGTGSALAGEGPKLEPPARPTRSEVEGIAVPTEVPGPPSLGGAASAGEPASNLPPIYRPPAPPVPRLLRPQPMLEGETSQAALPPALEGPRALSLEAVPDPSAFDLKPLAEPARPVVRSERVETLPKRIEPEPRRRGLFGLFRSEPNIERIEPAREVRAESRSEGSKPLSDPSLDTALRQKVRAQADRAYGRHLRDLDVRVMDQKIVIRAKADFFWNRRGLRKGLATLPGVRGHETTIEVD